MRGGARRVYCEGAIHDARSVRRLIGAEPGLQDHRPRGGAILEGKRRELESKRSGNARVGTGVGGVGWARRKFSGGVNRPVLDEPGAVGQIAFGNVDLNNGYFGGGDVQSHGSRGKLRNRRHVEIYGSHDGLPDCPIGPA